MVNKECARAGAVWTRGECTHQKSSFSYSVAGVMLSPVVVRALVSLKDASCAIREPPVAPCFRLLVPLRLCGSS